MPVLSLPEGVVTPLVTPFHDDRVDVAQLRLLIARQMAAGIDGIVVCDQMGEGLGLAANERSSVLSCAVSAAAGRISVIAAVGTNCTSQTIDMVAAMPPGVSALLATVPYYSKPTAKGVVHHFRRIAEASALPLILDDDPKRTAKPLTSEILEELSAVDTILGVRHCAGDVAGFMTMSPALKRRYVHYAADDPTACAYLKAGASSVSSPIANLFPELVRSLYDMTRAHNPAGETAIQGLLCRAMRALGPIEPPTLKHALSLLTGCSPDVRLPLVHADDTDMLSMAAFLRRYRFCRTDGSAANGVVGSGKRL